MNRLDQRVPAPPSKAAEAGKLALSVDEAAAGRFSAAFAVPQVIPLPTVRRLYFPLPDAGLPAPALG